MTYKLIFDKRALKEWNKLGKTLRQQFKNKLAERMINPRIQADKLKGENDLYKIKLRSAGYRLVYQVRDTIIVVSVGKRERLEVYKTAEQRTAH
ncbi:TPA: type II toxin-antitoxin system RelE/ParE family toxin [Haemophilus influenzae]